MALYRENATGFVCEFAASPGAGYTLIASQPTDTLTNRVNWWRDVDKGSQTSDWHPSIQSGAAEVPGNDTRAGSGINIMPNDYSSFEWSGAISPVFTQAASYSRTATASYAGQYGVRLTLSGSGGYIGLASSSMTYNIVIGASSKWIVSAYVRPTTATAQTVTLTLVTALGSYSVTGTTEASTSAWKRISGVFDLSADTSIGAQLRISTSTTSASLDFDAVMLEEKVGPYDTPSVFYSPWGNGTTADEWPPNSITQDKLWGDLSTRIDLIDNSLPGSVNARLAAQYDTLVQQISTVAVGNGQFDSKVIWYFDTSADITGWTTNNASIAVSGGYMTVTASGTSPWFRTATIAIDGSAYQLVRLRVKRTAGTGWTGTLTYFYAGGSSSKTISESTSIGSAYIEADWDMSAETLWKSNTITGVRLQLGADSGDTFSIDWMGVGRNAPGASYEQVNVVRVLADNKNRVFYQGTAPASDASYTLITNDLWFDTANGYKPYRYTGSSWADTTDTRLATSWSEIYDIANATASPSGAAAQRINSISATASSKVKTYYQASTSAPSSPIVGDLWFKTDLNNRAFRWNGSAWVETSDVRIVNLEASVANKEEAKVGYCSINPGTNTTKALCEAAGGTWTSQPFATAVKQVSVTTDSGTATVEQNIQALATDTGALKTQYTVKLDVNGYVTGFGLYNAGAGASGFIVRADKFVVGSASNNTTPFVVDTGTGVTYINAAAIKNATITGAMIASATITDANITGYLSASRIQAGSILANQLSFTPVQSTNVVASINASSEGIRIASNKILIDGSVTFSSGYDPSTKLTTGSAAADVNAGSTTISGSKITAGTITASQIQVGTITAASGIIANAAITDANISSLSASKLTAGTIDASSITVSNLNATNITTGTLNGVRVGSGVDGSVINANSINASKIISGSITATQIAAGTISTSNLNFTPVQSSNVVASINASAEGIRIAGSKIYIDGNVSFSSGYDPTGKISNGGAASDINANGTTINGGKITTGTLTASQIQAGTISADRLVIGGITTDRIGANQVTKMAGGQIYWNNPNYYYNGYVGQSGTGYFSTDGGDLLVTATVTVSDNASSAFGGGEFWLQINGSDVDYKQAVVNNTYLIFSSSVTLQAYIPSIGTGTQSFVLRWNFWNAGKFWYSWNVFNGKR